VTKPKKNWLEWTVFGTGLVLICAVVVYLVFSAVTRDHQGAQLSLTLGEPAIVPGGYAVPVTIVNRGDVTAEGVIIEVKSGDPINAERGELRLPFVPHGSSRSGFVTFERRPSTSSLKARVLGYERP
jgi:uncharacterized protein (TIGR02588 family)